MTNLVMNRWPLMDEKGWSAWGIRVAANDGTMLDFPGDAILGEFAKQSFPGDKNGLRIKRRFDRVLYVAIPINVPKRCRESFLRAVQQATTVVA